jgi:hypothetical protein
MNATAEALRETALTAHADADTRTPAEVVLDAWQVYRRAQQVPFKPAVVKAQSDLFRQVDRFTRTDDRHPFAGPDTGAIEDAINALVASVEWHCGPDAAAHVSGEPS